MESLNQAIIGPVGTINTTARRLSIKYTVLERRNVASVQTSKYFPALTGNNKNQ
jgi:hypothetical protein